MQAGAADYLVKGQINKQLLDRAMRYALAHSNFLKLLREMAVRDALTSLYNRRELHRFLEYELGRSRRYKHKLSFLLIDIDHFKKINDQFGHRTGDEALRQISQLLISHYRNSDLLARFGGDEFAVVMTETSAEDAYQGAKRLKEKIETKPLKVVHMDGSSVDISITVSIGVAEYPADADSSDHLIEAADQALYMAKTQGRNQVVRFHTRLAKGVR
jgi:diguanylate cyclase (GGDEF)-like protein